MWQDLERIKSAGSANCLKHIAGALSDGCPHELEALRRFVGAKLYFGSSHFDGAIALLDAIGHISINDSSVILADGIVEEDYPRCDRFIEAVLKSCSEAGYVHKIFGAGSMLRNSGEKGILIRKSHIPINWIWMWGFLSDIGLIIPNDVDTYAEVVSGNVDLVLKYVVTPLNEQGFLAGRSLEALRAELERKANLGRRCEDFALDFERVRLKAHQFVDNIKLVSDKNVGAGFDLISFESNQSVTHDRFIEVKACGQTGCFYWSNNEADVARELGQSYFLYLVDPQGINKPGYAPRIIQHPSEFFQLHAAEWTLSADSFRYCPAE